MKIINRRLVEVVQILSLRSSSLTYVQIETFTWSNTYEIKICGIYKISKYENLNSREFNKLGNRKMFVLLLLFNYHLIR